LRHKPEWNRIIAIALIKKMTGSGCTSFFLMQQRNRPSHKNMPPEAQDCDIKKVVAIDD